MHRATPPAWLSVGAGIVLAASPLLGWSSGYGSFDPRTLALGGTAVAMGDLSTGHMYNPALTATHKGEEGRRTGGYHSLLANVGTVSAGARTASDAITDRLEQRLQNAIDRFNTAPSAENAAFGEAAAMSLQNAMTDLAEGDIVADGYFGYSVAVPGDAEGGAFYMGARLLGGGVAQIRDQDVDLVGDYIAELGSVREGNPPGQLHPELFDEEDGSLRSPEADIRSEAQARGMLLVEIGVSASRTWQVWGKPWTFGAAPKAVAAGIFDSRWQVEDEGFESVRTDSRHLYLNADLGTSVQLTERWRAALAVKDVLPRSFTSNLGHEFKVRAQPRLGLAHQSRRLQWGLDMDLVPIANIHDDNARQDVSTGVEWLPLPALKLRLGYRHDVHGEYGGLASVGLGLVWRALSVDFAYAQGSSGAGAGLRLGIRQ